MALPLAWLASSLSPLAPLASAQNINVQADATTGVLWRPTAFITGNSLLTTTAAAAAYQPLDADLTAIAALTTTANGRSLLTATGLTAAGLSLTNGAAIDALGAVSTAGLLTRTAANTYTARTITGTAGQITVTNGDGVSGAPTISLPSTITQATTFSSALTVTGSTSASSGAIQVTSADPSLRLKATGTVVADQNTYEIRNIGATSNTYLQFRTVNDANSVFTTRMALWNSGGLYLGNGGSFADPGAANLWIEGGFRGASLNSPSTTNLVLGTTSFGTALTFTSATGIATFAPTTASTSTSTGAVVIGNGSSGGLGVGGAVFAGSFNTASTIYGGLGVYVDGSFQYGINTATSQLRFRAGGVDGRATLDSSGNFATAGSASIAGSALSTSATGGIGYGTGAGGTVTQITSRTTGVTLNKVTGAITLFSAAGSTSWQTFTVTNSAVAATDVVIVSQKSGTDLYEIHVTAVAAGSFNISFKTTGGTTTEQPVFNFAVIKGVTS